MELKITKQAMKQMAKAPAHIRSAAMTSIRAIAAGTATDNIDVRPLAGRANEFRLRRGAYRAIFTIEGDTLTVTAFGPRGDIYRR